MMTELTIIGCVLTSSCKMSCHSKDDKEGFGLNPDRLRFLLKPFIGVGLDCGSNIATFLLNL